MQHGVNAVLEARAIGHQRGAFGGFAAQAAGIGVGLPHPRQVIQAQQVRQHGGVHAVGLDLGLGDGAGAQGIGDHHLGDEGLQQLGDGPAVEGGLQRHPMAAGEIAAGEGQQGGACGGELPAPLERAGVVQQHGFHRFQVDIQSGKWHTGVTPSEESGVRTVLAHKPDDPETRRTGVMATPAKSVKGTNGTYLFELEAQPGGPEGRPLTTAGSEPIPVPGRPRGVRPRSPRLVRQSSHLVPSPVSTSRTHNGPTTPPAGQAVASWSAASLYFNHARYDELGRLKTAGAASYTYDGFGNRLTQTAPSMNLAYNASNNRITSTGYTYDANGNVTATPELTLAYDVENRLVEAVHATNGTERYAYAPNGQRVWKSGWQGGIYFYGVDGKVLGLYRLTEVYYGEPGTEPVWFDVMQEQWTNVYLGGRMVRGRNYSVVEDRLGTVNGPAMNPYGDGQVFEGYGFTGYYHDGITGFDYAQQRYYAPALGRFTTPDPYQASAAIARPQSWNRYAYVENDPVNFVDPSGLEDFSAESGCTWNPTTNTLDCPHGGVGAEQGYYYNWWMTQLFAAQIIGETQPVYLDRRVGQHGHVQNKGGLKTNPRQAAKDAWSRLQNDWKPCLDKFLGDRRFEQHSFEELLNGGISWFDTRQAAIGNVTVDSIIHNGVQTNLTNSPLCQHD